MEKIKILIIVLAISVGFLSGCTEQKEDAIEEENKECSFVGKWIGKDDIKWRFETTKFYWYSNGIVIENEYTLMKDWELNTGILVAVVMDKTTYVNYVFNGCDEILLYYQTTGETNILTRVE